MLPVRHLTLVLGSAAAYALAFPPWYLWPFAWLALVPLLAVTRVSTPGRAALAGLVWGCAAIWSVAWWVAPAIAFYYQQPWWFGVAFCAVGCMILWGSHYALFAALASWLHPQLAPAWRPPALAAVWVACELLRARLVTGEPWMLLGYALADQARLIQAADLGGVYLLSFVVFLVNAAVAEVVDRRAGTRAAVRMLATTAAAVGALASYGGWRLATTPTGDATVPVRVVQGNNEVRTQWRREFYGDGLEQYLALSRRSSTGRARLLVWPESAVTFFLEEEPAYRAHIARMLAGLDATLLVGGPARRPDAGEAASFNSAFVMDGAGVVQGRYDKRRLLPFAEYFPLRFLAFLRRHFDAVRDFTPGGGALLLPTPVGQAAVVICFEAIFPELVAERMRAGADILVNLSNDVWLAGAGPAQHLQMVVLRAVENRVWVVRATTTGVSAAIDPLGRVRVRTEPGVAAAFDQNVSAMAIVTPYRRFGDWFAFGCLAFTGVVLIRLRKVAR